ncbi:MAG: Ig-like domain-containing protein, partial [Conchiformibius sp.]|nr:Ig-like domain-containing protein [Conchiformibius sp.]
DVSELKVEVNINGKTQTVSVRPTDTKWSLTVDNSELAAMQGSRKISVTATAKDGANNTATSAKAEQNYQVDTLLTRPAVSINDIAPINTAAADKKTVLSGTVTQVDGDATVKSVTVKIGDSSKTAMVKGNNWTLEVTNGELAGKSKITVTAEVSDGAGNSQTSAPTEKTYTAVQVQDIRITLDQVTQDNVIRNDELSGNIQISGRVAGQNAADTVSKTVDLVINGQTHKAVVANNFTFTTAVPASVLKADTDRTIEANIGGKTYGIHTYQVEEAVEKALIRITKIDGDNVVGADRVPSLVALSGKIDTSAAPLLSKPYNRESLHSVVLEINGKKYEAAIDETDFRFKVMISESELRAANGRAIKATINHWDSNKWVSDQVVEVVKSNGRVTEDYLVERLIDQGLEELFTKLQVALEGEHIVGTNGNYTVRADNLPKPKSQIEGFIDGNVRTDGNTKVEIDVHGKKYNGTLKSDKTFTAEVDTADLLADTDRTVTAKLVSGSLNAQDSATYLTHRPATNGDGQFVSEHGKINYTDLPYFIRNLGAEWDDRYHYGYLSTKEVGKGGTIRYYFADQAYLNSLPSLISDLEKNKALAGPYEKLIEAAIDELTNVKNGNPAVFSQTNQDRIANILKYIGENSNLKFLPAASVQEADITFFLHGLIDKPGADGYAHYGGNVHLLRDSFEGENFNYITAIHEIFHSLGMKHPHRDEDDDLPNTPVMDKNEDHAGVTVMSYNNEDFNKTDAMRIFDLAFLHYRHGVNPEQRKGNDVYTFKAFNRHHADGDIYIWDGGGVDTFDASGEAQGVTVNLMPGSWIHSGAKAGQLVVSEHKEFTVSELLAGTGGKTLWTGIIDPDVISGIFDNTFVKGQAFIGYGTQIENLIGSAHNDTLTGNNADNAIYGGAGDDVINGGKGNDWLDGGSGNDTLKGGMGDDVYIVGEAGDKVEEASGQGNDHVYSSRTDFTLSAFVENLTLLGSAKTGTGNDAANKLEGNNLDNTLDGKGGDDTLNGGGGSDMLTGGTGKDTFVFSSMLDGSIDTITDFSQGEDKIALSRAVFTAIQSETAITTHIQYDNATGKLSYDADGAGGAAAVEFAQLNGGLGTLDQNQFTLIA